MMRKKYISELIKKKPSNVYNAELHKFAEINKIPLTYLLSLSPNLRKKSYRYIYHVNRLVRIFETLKEITTILKESNIKYAIFKTLPPFEEAIADIDILCFNNYNQIVNMLLSQGFKIMETYYYCTTLEDYKTNFKPDPVMIDIYNIISIGGFEYIDKKNLSRYVKKYRVSQIYPWIKLFVDDFDTYLLSPAAELATVVAHSIYKNLSYLLRDFMYIHSFSSSYSSPDFFSRFIKIVKENNLTIATTVYFSVSYHLAKLINDHNAIEFVENTIEKLHRDLVLIPFNDFLVKLIPYKYPYKILLRAFFEKVREKNSRKSLPLVFTNFKNKIFLVRLFRAINLE